MINSVTHLNKQISFALVLSLLFLENSGCSKPEKQEKFVAKVNDAVLTEDQISSALNDEDNKGKYRSEFINDWIENEILFQEAEKAGVLKENKFNSLVEKSKRHLAASLFIEKLLGENKIEVTDDEISKYYDAHKNEFKLPDDAYKINIVNFSDFDKAVKFRKAWMETGWDKALNAYRTEKSIISSEPSKLIYKFQVQPLALLRIITNLQPSEVSIVVETEPLKFAIVQLIEKLDKDTVPALESVKDDVAERLMMAKRREFVRSYIDKLISDHNLEIVRYSE